jgi:hypothetical protein
MEIFDIFDRKSLIKTLSKPIFAPVFPKKNFQKKCKKIKKMFDKY